MYLKALVVKLEQERGLEGPANRPPSLVPLLKDIGGVGTPAARSPAARGERPILPLHMLPSRTTLVLPARTSEPAAHHNALFVAQQRPLNIKAT